MAITASLVKDLRDRTNAGMMECKKALTETDGDIDAAIKLLREKGIAKAGKKAERDANEGVIAAAISEDSKSGLIFEVNCETDFVAKNDNFAAFVNELGDTLLASDAADLDAALAVSHGEGTVDEFIKAKVLELGENLVLRRLDRVSVSGDGQVASYIHMGGKVGVLLELAVGNAETTSKEAFQNLIKDLTLHIAASAPQGLTRDEISADLIEGEKDIYRVQLREQGKPEEMIEKILIGKVNKFYGESVLLEQGFVKDPDVSIQKLLESTSKELGDTVTITSFKRYGLGS